MNQSTNVKIQINNFVNSYWCPVAFFILGSMSYLFDIYYALLITFLVWCIFCLLYLKNIRGLLMPLLLINLMNKLNFQFNNWQSIIFYILIGAFIASCVYYYFCAFKQTKKFKTGVMFWGLIGALLALLLSGVGYAAYREIYAEKLLHWLGYFTLLFVVYI